MVSKKFKQDFLKIQRALEDKLQKNPKQLLSNLGMKKTCNSVKIRKALDSTPENSELPEKFHATKHSEGQFK